MSYAFDSYMPLENITRARFAPLGENTYLMVYTTNLSFRAAVINVATKVVYTSIYLDDEANSFDVSNLTATTFVVLWSKPTSFSNNNDVALIAKVDVIGGTTCVLDGLQATFFGGEFFRYIDGVQVIGTAANGAMLIFYTSEFYLVDFGMHVRAAIFAFNAWAVQPLSLRFTDYTGRNWWFDVIISAIKVSSSDVLVIAAGSTDAAVRLLRSNFTSVSLIDTYVFPEVLGEGNVSRPVVAELGQIDLGDGRFLVTWGERYDGALISVILGVIVNPGVGAMTVGAYNVILYESLPGSGQGLLLPGSLVQLNNGNYRLTYYNGSTTALRNIEMIVNPDDTIEIVHVDYGEGIDFYVPTVAIPAPTGALNSLIFGKFYELTIIQEGNASFWEGTEDNIALKSELPALEVQPGALAISKSGLAAVGFGNADIAIIQSSGDHTNWTDITNNHPADGRITHLEWID